MTNADDFATFDFDFPRARKALLRWFETNGRRFPWRDNPTPYRVLVSEIMLQQTTTKTVLGYFERFLQRFPDARALAAASEEETLKYWEGLGYYRRAKSLRAAACEITTRWDGNMPGSYEEIASLPGVGRYTTGAILSFGFNKRGPILEANTTRLHARLLGLREEITSAPALRTLWRFAEAWLPRETKRASYRQLNGALTDLGSVVCVPNDPLCERCPLSNFCVADRLSIQALVPVLKKKEPPIQRTDVALIVSRGDLKGASNVLEFEEPRRSTLDPQTDVLLALRPRDALWSGLWDFPRFEITNPLFFDALDLSDDFNLAERVQFFLEEEAGATVDDYAVGRALATLRHSVTKYRVTLRVCQPTRPAIDWARPKERLLFDLKDVAASNARAQGGARRESSETLELRRQSSELRWTPLDALERLPLSSPSRRVARLLWKIYLARRV